MKRRIKITEEQYNSINSIVNEQKDGEQFTATPEDAHDVKKTAQVLKSHGLGNVTLSIGDADDVVSGTSIANSGALTESNIVTKKQIMECRQKYLEENTDLYSLNEFVRQLKKK